MDDVNEAHLRSEVRNLRRNTTNSGKSVTNFTLKPGDRGPYIRCVAWEEVGEVAFNEGDVVDVKGELRMGRDWVDKQGQDRKGELEVNCREIVRMGDETRSRQADDDIPF